MNNKNEKIKLNNLGIFHSEQLDVGNLSFWWQKKYKEIQNNQKLINKQEWLIEINNAMDELEKYDLYELKKFLPKQKSNLNASGIVNMEQVRNKKKFLQKSPKLFDYQKIQDEIYKKTLKNNPYYCSYCGCTGKDVWSEPWVKRDGVYDFSKFKKKCPMCLGKIDSQIKSKKFLPKLNS
tara:strand:+ start:108 stop:644 length:537 start_codon:yes stop_codon:yes gene_type:complete